MTEQLDTEIKIVELDKQNSYGKLVIMPLEGGYGTILGDSLRKVLLSSSPGTAISKISIQGVAHEVSTIKGVKEDVPEIILNLKGIAVKKHSEEPILLNVDIKGPRVLTAKGILVDTDSEIKNPDHYITALNGDALLEMQITIINGKGYKISESNKTDEDTVGDIVIDSLFSPVEKVNFTVDNARVGQTTDYGKLTIEVWTNGVVRPQNILSEEGNIPINCLELPSELPNHGCNTNSNGGDNQKDKETRIVVNIEELNSSLRLLNCLERTNISTIRGIASYTGVDMMKTKNLGEESLDRVEEKLQEIGLAFKRKIRDEWRRINID